MRLKRLEVLSSDELELIHNTSLDLLQKIGVKVESPDARKILKDHGALTHDHSQIVQFPRELVLKQIKLVPPSFELYGSTGEFHVQITTENTHYATIGTPVKMYDPSEKKLIRTSVLADTIKQIRIVDASKNIICSHVDVWPNDCPYLELHYHAIKAWASHSKKPYGLGCYGKTASEDMMKLTSFVVGGEQELIQHGRLVGFFNTTSPFILPQIMTNGMEVFAKWKQPLIIAPCMVAGSTAPVTLAGLLVQSNMEILSSITLSQIYTPHTPILFGSVSCPIDLPTGNVAWGGVETGLITAGIAQLARRYNIPSRCPGAITDSKALDLQNGFERMMTLMFAAQAGINYITCAGTYESSLSEALELLVIDDDLIGMVNRALEGVTVNENTLGHEVIERVAASGKDYLRERHTVQNMRKEIYSSTLVDRNRRQRWWKEGGKDIVLHAREKVDQILATQQGPILSNEVEKQFADYLKIIQKRTMDSYRIMEGLDNKASAPSSSKLEDE